jgi:hypothetical protein
MLNRYRPNELKFPPDGAPLNVREWSTILIWLAAATLAAFAVIAWIYRAA